MSKNSLIIGISGQDGSYLARFLLEQGHEVAGTSRDAQMTSFSNLERLGIRKDVRLFSASLNDFRSVLQVLKDVSPDEVYNLGGQSSVGLSFEQPVETFDSVSIGTLNLLESIRFLGRPIKLYNAASSECFGNTEGKPANETMAFKPQSPYGFAKAGAFWAVSNYRDAYGLFACSGLMFNHESPLRPKRFVTRKIVHGACRIRLGLQRGLTLGNIDIQRDWGWAPEYVKAMWLMLRQDTPKDYVIATGATYSLREFIKTVFSHLGLDWEEHVGFNNEFIRPSEIMISRANPERAKKELNWVPEYRMPDVARMMAEEELKRLERKLQPL